MQDDDNADSSNSYSNKIIKIINLTDNVNVNTVSNLMPNLQQHQQQSNVESHCLTSANYSDILKSSDICELNETQKYVKYKL